MAKKRTSSLMCPFLSVAETITSNWMESREKDGQKWIVINVNLEPMSDWIREKDISPYPCQSVCPSSHHVVTTSKETRVVNFLYGSSILNSLMSFDCLVLFFVSCRIQITVIFPSLSLQVTRHYSAVGVLGHPLGNVFPFLLFYLRIVYLFISNPTKEEQEGNEKEMGSR